MIEWLECKEIKIWWFVLIVSLNKKNWCIIIEVVIVVNNRDLGE